MWAPLSSRSKISSAQGGSPTFERLEKTPAAVCLHEFAHHAPAYSSILSWMYMRPPFLFCISRERA